MRTTQVVGLSLYLLTCKTMGQSKNTLQEMIDELYNQLHSDEDYQYELWKQRTMDDYHQELMEREAYEQHLADKY